MRKLRQMLPPRWLIAVFVVVYLICVSGEWAAHAGKRLPWNLLDFSDQVLRAMVVITFCVVYGLYRMLEHHPLANKKLKAWLELTPWTSRKPLPFGTPYLHWLDLLVPGAVMLAEWPHPCIDLLWIPLTILLTYLVTLTVVLAKCESLGWAYAMTLGLSSLVLFWYSPGIMLGLSAALAIIGMCGLSRSLARFPWNHGTTESYPAERAIGMPIVHRVKRTLDIDREVRWPFVHIANPGDQLGRTEGQTASALTVLFGWWAFIIAVLVGSDDWNNGWDIAWLACLFCAAMARLSACTTLVQAPITLWGRLLTGRLVVPEYDRVFVVPAMTIFVGLAVSIVGGWLRLPPVARFPAMVAIVTYFAATAKPMPREWWLTGGFHMRHKRRAHYRG